MSIERSTIFITCPDRITTQISKGHYSIKAPTSESLQREAAYAIVSQAHYNEIFEVKATLTGEFEKALAQAHHFKIILRKAMHEQPELNLIILGDNPKEWEYRKTQSFELQRDILRKSKVIAEKMKAYPALLKEAELKQKAQGASDLELWEAKTWVEKMTHPPGLSPEPLLPFLKNFFTLWPLVLVAFTCFLLSAVLLMLVSSTFSQIASIAIAASIGLMFLGTALLGIAIGLTSSEICDRQALRDHFNFRTGRLDILGDLAKIAPDFLKNS